jgi:hypothetical protein
VNALVVENQCFVCVVRSDRIDILGENNGRFGVQEASNLPTDR